MAITYVGSQEESGEISSSPHTIVVDTGTRTNGLLVVTFIYAATSQTSFTMTYAGVSMTEVVSWNNNAASQWFKIFALANPSDGSDDLVVTLDGLTVVGRYTTISWYDGAKQTSPEDQTNTGTGATDPSLTITPTLDGELIVSAYRSEADAVLTPTSPHTTIQDIDEGPRVKGTGYTIQTTAAEETVAWTGVDDTWYMAVASFFEASGAATRRPLPTFFKAP